MQGRINSESTASHPGPLIYLLHFIRVIVIVAFKGPLEAEGHQGMMGHLGLRVNQDIQESLEFLDSKEEMDVQDLWVSVNHKHTQII